MRIAIAQLNPIVGDLAGNRAQVARAAERAAEEGADLLVAPELVLTGYPPMDLLARDGFVEAQLRELDTLREASKRVTIVLGAVLPANGAPANRLWNAGVVLSDGEQVAIRPKSLLPTYDVFDEKRYFAPAT